MPTWDRLIGQTVRVAPIFLRDEQKLIGATLWISSTVVDVYVDSDEFLVRFRDSLTGVSPGVKPETATLIYA